VSSNNLLSPFLIKLFTIIKNKPHNLLNLKIKILFINNYFLLNFLILKLLIILKAVNKNIQILLILM
jgi:hypothetical protein